MGKWSNDRGTIVVFQLTICQLYSEKTQTTWNKYPILLLLKYVPRQTLSYPEKIAKILHSTLDTIACNEKLSWPPNIDELQSNDQNYRYHNGSHIVKDVNLVLFPDLRAS